MKQYPVDFWNDHYSKEEFIYGTQPNVFFKKQLEKLKIGNILFPAEGEGRNAVYAASLGWDVTAFDISERGQEKAYRLANIKNVAINYKISEVLAFETDQTFDVIVLSYAHFPAYMRKEANQYLLHFLRPGGRVIFEAFAKAQLGNTSGGPK
ncbi:MAG: class I SAM-dependent methyltransferase, partial [Cellulophaga sp.]|nr:class I SAM-dependent methyltransferase [Cellulophaga sp.]